MSRRCPWRWLSVIAVAAVLAVPGCGGGGGGGDDGGDDDERFTGTPVTSSATPRLASRRLDETTSESVALTTEVEGDVVRAVSTDGDVASGSVEGGTVVISTNEVDRPESTVILVGDGEGNAVATINVAIANESAQALVDEVETWLAERDALLILDEDAAIYDLLVESAYLSRTIDAAREAELKAAWEPTAQDSHEGLDSDLDALDQSLLDYRSSQIGDAELASTLDTVKSAMDVHQQYALNRITDLKAETGANLPLVTDAIAYSPETATVSRYVGNENVGENTTEGWIFDPGYSQFELAVDISELAVCQQDL